MSSIKIYFFSCFLLISSCFFLKAQTRKIDSLQNLLKTAKEDTLKVQMLNRLGSELYYIGEYAKTIEISTKSALLGEKLNYKNGIARAYNQLGNIYNDQADYPKALNFYHKALKLQEEIHNLRGVSAVLNNIGNIYRSKGDAKTATENYLRSIKIKEEIADTPGLGFTFNNLGIVYENTGKFSIALEYYFKSIKIWQTLQMEGQTAGTYDNIGNIYGYLHKYDSSLAFHFKAIGIREREQDAPGLASSYLNTGVVFGMAGNNAKAIDLLNKSVQISKQLESIDLLADAEESLSEIYEKIHESKKALEHYKLFILYRDSIFNEDNTKKMVQSEMNFEFDKKEAASKLDQEKKEAVAAADSRKQKVIIWSVCGILFLVFCFAVFAYRSFLQKQKANKEITKQKDVIEEKQKEILDSIYYARRIQRSLLPNEKYIAKCLKKN